MLNKIHKLLLGIACISILSSTSAFADVADLTVDTGCTTKPSYTGVVTLPAGRYDAYVKLARRGETIKVQGYTQESSSDLGDCGRLGTRTVNATTWTPLGSLTSSEDGTDMVVQLASSQLAGVPNANRPMVMLVPHKDPPCVPTTECIVSIDGQSGTVQPTGTMLNQDSLHVLVVTDPSNDTLHKVNYFANDQLVYSLPTLQPFDMRYASFQGESLTRVAQYDSGQQIVFSGQTPDVFSDNFGNFLFRLSNRYPLFYYGTLVFVSILIVWAIVSLVVGIFRRRHFYRVHHGLIKADTRINPILAFYYKLRSHRTFYFVKMAGLGVVLLVGMGVVIIAVNTYALTMFTVDGKSMQRGLHTGDQMLVNKLPVTLASINGREYVPKRGEIVIVRAVFGNVTSYDESTSDLDLIKRVIGLPGDRVVVKDGHLTIYNKQHPDGFQPDKGSSWERTMVADLPTERLDLTLGPSELFVSGDNRPESIDSRFNGPLKMKEIIGVVIAKV